MVSDNRGPELQAVCSTFVSLAFVACALRIYVRGFMVKNFGWDDAWMVSAMLTYIMFATCAIGGIHYGTGRHMTTLGKEDIMKALRYWWLCYVAYCLTMISVKISVGLFLLRVTIHKLQRWIIYIVMALTVATGLLFFFVTLLQCSPVSYFWNRYQPGSCISIEVIIALTYLYSAVSAVCDWTLGLLPIWLVWNLNMRKSAKIALVPILSMACIASAAVIVRLAFVNDFKNPDFLYATVDIAIWSDIEQGLAITAGSLATLRPLYWKVSGRLGWTHHSTGQKASSGKETPFDKPSSSRPSVKKNRSGPFSLMTFTKNEAEDDYGLDNVRPIRLRDEVDKEAGLESGYGGWQREGSEEELHKGRADLGGITKKTDVYLSRR